VRHSKIPLRLRWEKGKFSLPFGKRELKNESYRPKVLWFEFRIIILLDTLNSELSFS
jgi:hypothetical protein